MRETLQDLTDGQRAALLDLAHAYQGHLKGWASPDEVDGRSARGLVPRGLAEQSEARYKGRRYKVYRLTETGRRAAEALLELEDLCPVPDELRGSRLPETGEEGELASDFLDL